MKEKKWFKSFLNKLSEANKEEYGDKPLDCCKLNKETKGHFPFGKWPLVSYKQG